MKKYIHINNCYGTYCPELEREYSSPEEFFKELKALEEITIEEMEKKYGNWYYPLSSSKPILVEIELHEDEDYRIDEHDGLECILFFKKGKILSTSKIVEFQE